MPYVIISTQIRLENGITYCGDEESDPALMSYLKATLQDTGGNPFKVYCSSHCPRIVLNELEKLGYRVVAGAGVGQTCVWTLYAAPESLLPIPQSSI